MRRGPIYGGLLAMAAFCLSAGIVSATEDDIVTGDRLAAMLRAARGVVSSHQSLINDPAVGEKNLTGDSVMSEAIDLYIEREGEPPSNDSVTPQEVELFEAQIAAIREIVDENQAMIDEKGVGFKGFIPAVFARLVNERFAEKVGDKALTKVTAPVELVRNRKARPDDWERQIIETRFLGSDWPKGQAYTEEVDKDGRKAFRMLIPEYYSASCLTCHGQPKGEVDVTGYPKEGGAEGDLAGAISITLFR